MTRNTTKTARTSRQERDSATEYRARQLAKLASTPEEAKAAIEAVLSTPQASTIETIAIIEPVITQENTTMTENTTVQTESAIRMAAEVEAQMKTEDELVAVAANKATKEAAEKPAPKAAPKAKAPKKTVEEAKAERAAIMAKKKDAKTSPKAPTKTEPEPKTKTVESNGTGRKPKDGLRGPQIRILQVLAKSGKAMPRKEIAVQAPCDLAFCTEYLGSHDDTVRLKNDSKKGGFPSLRTLGYVKAEQHDVDGKDVVLYTITKEGRKALEKALKEIK